MHRFFAPPFSPPHAGGIKGGGTRVVLQGDVAHQISAVLRMRAGDTIVVLDDSGWEFEVRLTQVGRTEASGEILERRPAGAEPRVRLTLFQSLLKRDSLEWVLQKCTEIGVAAFVPVVSQRTIVSRPQDVSDSKIRRWRRIVVEAAEQSRRGRLPALHPAVRFEQAVAGTGGFDLSLIPWEEEQDAGLRAALAAVKGEQRGPLSVALFVGPEGGFAGDEVALAKAHGAQPITLGPRILRAETAAVVAASLILYECGELE